jgi:hypothetical protein
VFVRAQLIVNERDTDRTMRGVMCDIPVAAADQKGADKVKVVPLPYPQGSHGLQLTKLVLTKSSGKKHADLPYARVVVTAHVRGLDDEAAEAWQLAVIPVNVAAAGASTTVALDVRCSMEVVGVSAAWQGVPATGDGAPAHGDVSLMLTAIVSQTRV